MTKWISFKCYIPLLRRLKLHSVGHSNISGTQPTEACCKLHDKPYIAAGCFGSDLWIVLNEMVMVVKQEWEGVWICGVFACCSSICSVVTVNVTVIFLSPLPSWASALHTEIVTTAEIPECTRYVPAQVHSCTNLSWAKSSFVKLSALFFTSPVNVTGLQ